MKKFCSKCGNQLDLGKRNCMACQAFNPFFISGYTHAEPVNKNELEQELLDTKEQAAANEAALRAEQLEHERIEQSLKTELLRVKEETEQYKKETLDLVIGVQKELQDIDKENKLLKEKVQWLKSSRQVEQAEMIAPSSELIIPKEKEKSKAFIAIAAVSLAVLIAGFSYFALSKSDNKTNAATTTSPQQTSIAEVNLQPVKKVAPLTTADTSRSHKLQAIATPPTTKVVATAPAAVVAAAKPNNGPFSLTASRAMGDLVGKKLAGCDITINNVSEIDHLDNLILVEKLSATYLKYKCTVRIKQGSETYTSSPYIYYSSEGTFIKVDGTNCE